MWERIKKIWNSLPLTAKLGVAATAVALFVMKYRDVMMSIILGSAKRLMDKTEAQDQELAKEENAAKEEANKLVKEAMDLPSQKDPVDKDWYKK